MPYKDPEQKREYMRRWMAARRAAWLKEHGPCVECGSSEDLQVDHIDRTLKVSHKVWSWSEVRRNEELAKCQVLCWECHKKKTNVDLERFQHGTQNMYSKQHCRCSLCTAAHRESMRTWRENTGT